MVNNKIVSFDRNLTFNSVKIRKKKNFLGYVYSGMTIINKSILKLNFKNYQNFEQKLYPKIIKKFNTKFVIFKGFWHSIDNNKDIEATKNYSILKNILKLKKNLAK